MRELTAEEELTNLLNKTEQSFILKHSTRCPISTHAFREFEAFAHAHPDVLCVWINVIESRPLSNDIAKRTGIEHQSPQVLHIRDGVVCWDTSHHLITVDALNERL